MTRLRLFKDQSGSASAEFALLVPMLIILLFGGFEAGHFVWTQHKLVEAVRDGARFAARQPLDELCNGATSALSTDTENDIKLLTRTGQLVNASAIPKVPGWADDEISVTVSCDSFVDTGLYTALGDNGSGSPLKGPVVTVSTTGVGYPSLFNSLGILDSTITLTARSHAAGIGL